MCASFENGPETSTDTKSSGQGSLHAERLLLLVLCFRMQVKVPFFTFSVLNGL